MRVKIIKHRKAAARLKPVFPCSGRHPKTVAKASEGRVIRDPDSSNTSENGGLCNSPLRREIVLRQTHPLPCPAASLPPKPQHRTTPGPRFHIRSHPAGSRTIRQPRWPPLRGGTGARPSADQGHISATCRNGLISLNYFHEPLDETGTNGSLYCSGFAADRLGG
jgi:hypothetical protein